MIIVYFDEDSGELYACESDKEQEMLEVGLESNNKLDLTKGYKRTEVTNGQFCFNVCGKFQLWSN